MKINYLYMIPFFKSSKTIKIVLIIISSYIFIGLIIYFFQDKFIYLPDNTDFYSCAGFSNYKKEEVKGTRFYYLKGSDEVIVYYHGNGGSACDRSEFKDVFEETKKSVIFVEYIGYSNDKTQITSDKILEDVINIRDFINQKGFKTVTVYGQSIGSGPASFHASLGNVDKVVLVTPFSSLEDVVQSKILIYPASVLLKHSFNNISWLSSFLGEVVIIHGDNDYVVPHRFSRRLFESLKTKDKKYIILDGISHNQMWETQEFVEVLRDVLKG